MEKRILWVFVSLAVAILIPSGSVPPVHAASGIYVTQPGGRVAMGEDLDYASHEWHNAWDMNQESEIHLFMSPTCDKYGQPLYLNSSFSNGIWSASYNTSFTNDPWLWLLDPGYHGTLHVGKDGNVHPIDASEYTQLTFRMYLGPSFDWTKTPGGKLAWTDTDSSAIMGSPSDAGTSRFFRVFPGWNVYTIDLTKIGLQAGSLNWVGSITGLRLYTGLRNSGAPITDVKMDWVRLTPRPTNHTVAWSGAWTSGATAQLSFSSDAKTWDPMYMFSNYDKYNNGVVLPDSISAGSNGSGSYNVPASFPPGSEYVQVSVTDGGGTVRSTNSAGPWLINARPDFTFVAPSFTSGDEFSAKVVGNAWDMSDSADVPSSSGLTGPPLFTNGILTGVSSPVPDCGSAGVWGDPILYLDMGGKAVDTSYYRYWTVKVKIDAPFDFGNGWVSRFYWAQGDWGHMGAGNDMALYTGWNTFTVDMWGNVQDDVAPGNLSWRSGFPNILRFDPHEIPPSTQFDVDYIKLNADSYASLNSTFSVQYLLNGAGSVTFYYSPQRNPNGRTRAIGYQGAPPSTSLGRYRLFLPILQRDLSPIDLPPGTQLFSWDLRGVPSGSYYISADVNDGYKTTTWYSETPVIINP
ncbi:MAG: hypothetical protein M1570_05980 [Chloroflexi bacterium]|nr:hypothetical protein [Chloroflexota bacterium]